MSNFRQPENEVSTSRKAKLKKLATYCGELNLQIK